jgi:hypothetical protein
VSLIKFLLCLVVYSIFLYYKRTRRKPLYVQPLFEKKTGRTLLFYYTAKRVKGKIERTKVLRIGYVDEFLHEYPDPLAHFRSEAKRLTQEASRRVVTVDYTAPSPSLPE